MKLKKSANANNAHKRDHLLFLMNASADTIATANITTPDIPYSSSADIPDAGDDFLMGENVMVIEIDVVPLTVIEPDDEPETEYPETLPMVKEYVPLGAVNVMVSVVDDLFAPLKFTYHSVPEGRPVSENITV